MAEDYRELKLENNNFDLIVETLTDSVCAQQKDAQRENVQELIKNSGTLFRMIPDTDSLQRYVKMAKEEPEALYREYGQHLRESNMNSRAREEVPEAPTQPTTPANTKQTHKEKTPLMKK